MYINLEKLVVRMRVCVYQKYLVRVISGHYLFQPADNKTVAIEIGKWWVMIGSDAKHTQTAW